MCLQKRVQSSRKMKVLWQKRGFILTRIDLYMDPLSHIQIISLMEEIQNILCFNISFSFLKLLKYIDLQSYPYSPIRVEKQQNLVTKSAGETVGMGALTPF